MIVRKDVAEAATPTTTPDPPAVPDPTPGNGDPPDQPPPVVKETMRRFYGSVKLNELRVSSGVGQVADEVISHLTGLIDSDVEVILEIRAKAPEGIPDAVVRAVSENATDAEVSGLRVRGGVALHTLKRAQPSPRRERTDGYERLLRRRRSR